MIKSGNRIKTVGELQDALKHLDRDTKLAGTWQSTWRGIYTYQAEDGTQVLDLDAEHYRSHIESGALKVDHDPVF